jgi:hypothetical protein
MGKGVMSTIVLAVSVLLVGILAPAGAQDRLVRLDGRVQWIAGQDMAVQLDTGGSVSVDLVGVPQDQYATMSLNERVTVFGIIPDGGRRVNGMSILRGDSLQAP